MNLVSKMIAPILITFSAVNCVHHQQVPVVAEAGNNSLQEMITGNIRFAHLKPVHPRENLQRLKDAAKAQHPFAIIVCCADSRVSPELVFDQGVGDLFVIRTAGNIIGDLELGSIEYAVEHLSVNLIVIMGHENCGAVKAFVEKAEAPGHIKNIIDSIKKEAEIMAVPLNDANRLDDCVKANIRHGIKQLHSQSKIVREKSEKNELQIVGIRYDLDDFTVSIIE